jgi:GT2 family glycosyltransferase
MNSFFRLISTYFRLGFVVANRDAGRVWAISRSDDTLINLESRDRISRGWYFWGFYHTEAGKRCYGFFQSTDYIVQARPLYGGKVRWRIVWVPKKQRIQISVKGLTTSKSIKEVWLIKTPSWYVWYKIAKRVSSISGRDCSSNSKPVLWRDYNRLLYNQGREGEGVSYRDWHKEKRKSLEELKVQEYDDTRQTTYIEQLRGINTGTKIDKEWVVIFRDGSTVRISSIDEYVTVFSSQLKKFKLCYFDESKVDAKTGKETPWFKGGWNREEFLSRTVYSNIWLIRRTLIEETINWYNEEIGSIASLTYLDVVYACTAMLIADRAERYIAHCPYIAYTSLEECYSDGSQLKRKQLFCQITEKINGRQSSIRLEANKLVTDIQWHREGNEMLSILIPTRDRVDLLRSCFESIRGHDPGCSIEVIVIDNDSEEIASIEFFEKLERGLYDFPVRVLKVSGAFNYSRINNLAAEIAYGSVLMLLNNDVEFRSTGWGDIAIRNAIRPEVGCVGALLSYQDGTIQHAGVLTGVSGSAGHLFKYRKVDVNVAGWIPMIKREVSAVTGACLSIEKKKWIELGGLDEQFCVNYNDVDLGLRALKCGYKNIYVPQIRAIHYESKTRGKPKGAAERQWKRELGLLKSRWQIDRVRDRYYSPHLTLDCEDMSIWLQGELYPR